MQRGDLPETKQEGIDTSIENFFFGDIGDKKTVKIKKQKHGKMRQMLPFRRRSDFENEHEHENIKKELWNMVC
jgi:hypothetical protein